jgi:hypothetical protein
MKQAILILATTLSLMAQQAFAHGEDKPGPHEGFVRMPGAFHTELVQNGPNSLNVFLLDIQWKNPSVSNSSLVITHKTKRSLQAKCTIKEDHYACEFKQKRYAAC